MFAATLTLTIDGVAKTLNRQNQDNFGSVYGFKSADGLEIITMQIRHSTDRVNGAKVNRHNVYLERTFAPGVDGIPKFYSVTFTLREREFSSPADLEKLSVGMLTLLGTLDTGLVVGDN